LKFITVYCYVIIELINNKFSMAAPIRAQMNDANEYFM
jgi:hypothetical protein